MSFHLEGDWVNAKAENFEVEAGSKGARKSLKIWEGSQAFPILEGGKKRVNLVPRGL